MGSVDHLSQGKYYFFRCASDWEMCARYALQDENSGYKLSGLECTQSSKAACYDWLGTWDDSTNECITWISVCEASGLEYDSLFRFCYLRCDRTGPSPQSPGGVWDWQYADFYNGERIEILDCKQGR